MGLIISKLQIHAQVLDFSSYPLGAQTAVKYREHIMDAEEVVTRGRITMIFVIMAVAFTLLLSHMGSLMTNSRLLDSLDAFLLNNNIAKSI